MTVEQNISLQPYNTFNIGVKARYFYALKKVQDLQNILNKDPWHSLPKLILGGGSNILLTQDYPGLVIHNELRGLTVLDDNADHIYLKIAAGENWHQLVLYCVNHHYGGIENLSLIPGNIGAAPIQNIGAYGVELCSVFESLEAIQLTTGALKIFNHHDCQFSYRNSIFKNQYKNQYLITSVTLKLNKKPNLNIGYGAISNTLKRMGVSPSIQSISQAVIHIRKATLPDPKRTPNAGSFFKNPIITQKTLKILQNKHPKIPYHSINAHQIKIPAAWLIEQCGWKGKTMGNAGVHKHHALVLINHNQANGSEIKILAEAIQSSVKEVFNITLTPEVNII